jgi:hypothetical protein
MHEIIWMWISVRDRLPEYVHEVLFVNGKGNVSVGHRLAYEKGCDEWASPYSIYFNDSIEQEYAVCKYWMPLPDAPNVEYIEEEKCSDTGSKAEEYCAARDPFLIYAKKCPLSSAGNRKIVFKRYGDLKIEE